MQIFVKLSDTQGFLDAMVSFGHPVEKRSV